MIRVRVELISAVNGEITELARMHISNIGGNVRKRDYHGVAFRGRSTADLNRLTPMHEGNLVGWSSQSMHVWKLVYAMLGVLGYDRK